MKSVLRVALSFSFLYSGVSYAVCSCPGGTGSPEDRLETYDKVFVGAKTKGRPWGCGSERSHTTVFLVTEVFKGVELGEEVTVLHDTNTDECGRRYANTEHLVYTDGETTLCDPGGAVFESEAEIEDLRDLVD
ncbi:MAG TPA: hypothetical protein QGF58_21815 [Myxococcota bacterium]|nr:hypothetical protein [Myxococcota bacterium]